MYVMMIATMITTMPTMETATYVSESTTVATLTVAMMMLRR